MKMLLLEKHTVSELAWQRDGACIGMNRDLFFPESDEYPDPSALAACHRCEVRETCLEWALKHDEIGIWGALTDAQRRAITIGRSRVRCPDCRCENITESRDYEICLGCGLSWPV